MPKPRTVVTCNGFVYTPTSRHHSSSSSARHTSPASQPTSQQPRRTIWLPSPPVLPSSDDKMPVPGQSDNDKAQPLGDSNDEDKPLAASHPSCLFHCSFTHSSLTISRTLYWLLFKDSGPAVGQDNVSTSRDIASKARCKEDQDGLPKGRQL
jgi:hypothetical protein